MAGSQLRSTNPTRPQQQTNAQQQEMTVPNDLIGCIIGKGGTKIAEIRQISGAMIRISNCEEREAGNTDRTITISGNPDAVAVAQYLINMRWVWDKNTITVVLYLGGQNGIYYGAEIKLEKVVYNNMGRLGHDYVDTCRVRIVIDNFARRIIIESVIGHNTRSPMNFYPLLISKCAAYTAKKLRPTHTPVLCNVFTQFPFPCWIKNYRNNLASLTRDTSCCFFFSALIILLLLATVQEVQVASVFLSPWNDKWPRAIT